MTPRERRPVDWIAIAVAAMALLSEAFGGYLHNDKVLADKISAVESRASALEAHRDDDHQAIQEIKATVERIENLLLGRQ